MALLFYSLDDDPVAWRAALACTVPDLEVRIWPEVGDPAAVDMALVWKPPPGLLAGLPNLRAIFSLGAGVDAMLADPTLPDLPLCRMVDPSLTSSMAEYVLTHVLRYHRDLDLYERQQGQRRWALRLPQAPATRTVGIMGLGVLGEAAAASLVHHGFTVRGWSRRPKVLEGVRASAGTAEMGTFLDGLDMLVCLLPLTAETTDILDARLFAALPAGARLINAARGHHLVEADLLAALDGGRLAHATLDVFREEPLPEGHPFWAHPRITITPHAASYSLPESGVQAVADNVRRLRAGEPLHHVVDRHQGY